MEAINFPRVSLSNVENPVPAMMSAAEFQETVHYFTQSPAAARSLVSPFSQALMFSLIRNARPDHVVEIGSYQGGTTECLSRALDANGHGFVHTVGPFDSAHFLPILESWPQNLQARVRFYPISSMNFFMQTQSEKISPWLVFVDGCHDHEFALFDIQCAARCLLPGGFIVIDNVSQAGPYFAAFDFLKMNSGWSICEWKAGIPNPTKAYDIHRTKIIYTDFILLRAPREFILNERPRTFGEIGRSAPRVEGIKINIVAPNEGTLHAQCVLRGFDSAQNIEREDSISRSIKDECGELQIMFEKPLVLEGTWPSCRVEPWFIWHGAAPLMLSSPPEVV